MRIDFADTYREYLTQLAQHPQKSTWDYGMHIKEADTLKDFARKSSLLLFILDYQTRTYPFIDYNTRQIMGHSNEAFYEGGVEFMFHNNRDFDIFNQDVFQDRLDFFEKHRNSDLSLFRFTFSCRFKGSSGEYHHIFQRNTIIHTTENNHPVGIFGFIWDATGQVANNKLIHQIEKFDPETGDWGLVLSKEYYPDIDNEMLLSLREIEILKWAVEGYSSKAIADKLHLSTHTVNTHRKNMLRKTNSLNSMDLYRFAIKYGLL